MQYLEPKQDIIKAAEAKLMETANDVSFIDLMKKQTEWQNRIKAGNGRCDITTDAQMSIAIDEFNGMKSALKELEAMRLDKVAFLTKVVDTLNTMFRGVRLGIEGSKKIVGEGIDKRRMFLEAEVRRKQAEEEEKLRKQQEEFRKIAEEEGVPEDAIKVAEELEEAVVVPEVPNTIKSDNGTKVHRRSDLKVKVVDTKKFLKFLISKNKRNEWMTQHLDGLLYFNDSAIKKLLKDHPKIKQVPGLEFEVKTKTI